MKEIVVVINPGSTSTKFAAYRGAQEIFSTNAKHPTEQLKPYPKVIDQYKFRADLILTGLAEHKVPLSEVAAVVGRGGLLHPIEGGTYVVNEEMIEDLRNEVQGEHASNLGGLIANEIAQKAGCKAFIVDPVVVDEKMDVTRISGYPGLYRRSIFHALNQKAVAKRYAADCGKPYDSLNLIVVHLGGGISVGAHRQGRVVDVNNALNGDGPFSPERSGTAPVGDLIKLCFSGKVTLQEALKMNVGKGGIVGLLGTNDMMDVENRFLAGDPQVTIAYRSMAYQVSKEICSDIAAFEGAKIDAILLTGGLARSKPFIDLISHYCSSSGLPIKVYPGEDEMAALREGVMRVLDSSEACKQYSRPTPK